MTENKEQIISQFNLAGMPSLPELLLREMDALLQPDTGAQMAGSWLSINFANVFTSLPPVSPDLADGEFQ
ncbi:MAG: hypothetical protein P8M72_11115 [Gammaproteobacteria bacterium]|nr:hypothetical protein [Gammaproteobacteria bacterium]